MSASVAGQVVAGKRLLLKIPARQPDKIEFFRVHRDPAFASPRRCCPIDREFHLVMPNMRYEVAEAQPYELRLCVNRVGAVWWWPIRLPDETGKSNDWWDSARLVANHAREHWTRCFSDRASNMYQPIVATIALPEPAWPGLTVTELLRLGFAQQVIDSPRRPCPEDPARRSLSHVPGGVGDRLRVPRPSRPPSRSRLLRRLGADLRAAPSLVGQGAGALPVQSRPRRTLRRLSSRRPRPRASSSSAGRCRAAGSISTPSSG